MAYHVAARGGSVVMVSYFVDEKKRAALVEGAEAQGVQVVFVRVLCDPDIAMGRTIAHAGENEFFSGTPCFWKAPTPPRW